jgi:hypothetical protein
MKTIKVRIACVINERGKWSASGWKTKDQAMMDVAVDMLDEGGNESRFWITAELPIPEVSEVAGRVEEDKS